MAKLVALVSSLCFLSLLGAAYCTQQHLEVNGYIYCDTCRALFETSLSEAVGGAKVRLECRDRVNSKNVTLSLDAECDDHGIYNFEVEGGHEDEICEVVLVESPKKDCNEIPRGLDRARVFISENNGMTQTSLFVNALGFIKKEPISGCTALLKSYGLLPNAQI